MTLVHDPVRQISYLQQCLASDKKPLALFLGAGCPASVRVNEAPLIPDISGITQFVAEELKSSAPYAPLLERLQSHFEADGVPNSTVETMLTHVRGLRAVAGKGEARGLTYSQLDTLDSAICDLIHKVVSSALPSDQTPYHKFARWIDALKRIMPIEIFTTNYDLLMEQALEETRVPYFDGFVGGITPYFDLRAMEEDIVPPRWARLWKVHGSINWYQASGRGVFRSGAQQAPELRRVIHPSHLKYEESRRLPYLAMIDRLRAFLKQPTAAMILLGYSFRDEHLNEVILQGLQSMQGAVAFGLLYGKLCEHQEAQSLAARRPNLNLLARDGAVIGGQKGSWPTVAQEAVPETTLRWIEWNNADPVNEAAGRVADLKLADFAVFGTFLEELAGNSGAFSEGGAK